MIWQYIEQLWWIFHWRSSVLRATRCHERCCYGSCRWHRDEMSPSDSRRSSNRPRQV